jgi:ribosomal protein S18 acetylase RimI-like enzyme
MKIHPLKCEDEKFLWEALYHAIYVPPSEPMPPMQIVRQPELSRYVVGWMSHPDDFGFKVEKDGFFAGAAWVRRWSANEHGYGFIDQETPELSISVLPAYRGCGLGTMLLRNLLSVAELRFQSISLSVSQSNPARRLYEREGFQSIGVYDDEGTIIMLRESGSKRIDITR